MKFKQHKIAKIIPPPTKEEFAGLVKSIKRDGLIEAITVHEGDILDGYNRYLACLKAGRAAQYVDFRDFLPELQREGPLNYVLMRNLHRRHLTTAQRADIATRLANMPPHRPDKSANLPSNGQVKQSTAAARLNVSERSMRMARKIQKEGSPEVNEAFRKGEMTLNAAYKTIKPDSKIKSSKKEVVLPTDSVSKLLHLAERNHHKFVCRISEYRIRVTREY